MHNDEMFFSCSRIYDDVGPEVAPRAKGNIAEVEEHEKKELFGDIINSSSPRLACNRK